MKSMNSSTLHVLLYLTKDPWENVALNTIFCLGHGFAEGKEVFFSSFKKRWKWLDFLGLQKNAKEYEGHR